MKPLTTPALRVALYEGDGAQPLAPQERFELVRSLLEKGYRVSCIRAGGELAAPDNGVVLVLGRFGNQRPPDGFDAAGKVRIQFRDLNGAAGAVEVVESFRAESEIPTPGGWKPWFPVIDYGRCTNCMQCLSFCLFDVYGVSGEGKIQVQNQSNCKTDCPACSRVCPEVAILFPKYRHGPIHGGEVNAEDVRRESMKIDISALLGGDIYQALRDRSAKAKSRFSKERDEERALKERQQCFVQLQKDLDIPPEVLAALPSLEEIQAKAEAAKARALWAQQT